MTPNLVLQFVIKRANDNISREYWLAKGADKYYPKLSPYERGVLIRVWQRTN